MEDVRKISSMEHFSEGQRHLADAVRAFGESNFDFESTLRWRFEGGLPDEVVQGFVNMDLSQVDGARDIVEACDSFVNQAIITEEITHCAGAVLPFPFDLFNIWLVKQYGTDEQKDFLLSDYLRSGRMKFAFAATEPNAGTASTEMTTSTRISNGRIVLNGRKVYVQNGEFAPYVLLNAVDAEGADGDVPSLNLWLVPRDKEGVHTFPIPKMGQSILPFADMVFDDVELDASSQIGRGVWDFSRLYHAFDRQRIVLCAMSLGLAQAAMDDAARYANSRRTGGKRIGDHQQISTLLADMEVKLANMRNLVYRAALAADEGGEARLDIALMKRYVPNAATEVASDAMQILGGRGYTYDERVGQIFMDCRGNQINGGTDQIMANIAGKLVLKKYE